jgi:hypothetical protein
MTTRRFSTVVLTTALCIAGIEAHAQDKPRFGVCKQQIADYVANTLKKTMTQMEVQSYADRSAGQADLGSALVYVEECPGFYAFDIFVNEDICENIPHIGKGGSYIAFNAGYDGC